MTKFSLLINIITIILGNNSWSYSNNSAVSFAESWGKNSQVHISDIRAIRCLGEHKSAGEKEGVRKSGRNDDDEDYDKDRYDALTQDYFAMMEDDINNNKQPKPTIGEIINNIDPKAQLSYHLGRITDYDAFRLSFKCRNFRKRLSRKIKNALRTIDKIAEREIYNILKSKDYVIPKVGAEGINMTTRLKKFLYKYKVLSPVLIFALISYFYKKFFAVPLLATFFGLAAALTLIYLAYKYLKCYRRVTRFREEFPERSRREFLQRVKGEVDDEEEDIPYSRESMDDSTEDIEMS
ncbi:hypothetical protein C922_04595 [Plasmodium inui San Antonio 1]|uniref:Pv-fam-d protein n=1 Tax=Plasmodium inui San Antonio 1 TaxID=1237626 RepID=W6ZW01_9APIC|nr:hypothetical protein C922_04595 [Plasmodium inui San Antonio 1]EUD64967.1 hypothetical protein C922_04595 [Plasmodium inui San Antonio 1]